MTFFIIEFDNRLSGSRPDLLEPISFGSEVRLLALEQELQELREQISTIVKNNKMSKRMYYKSEIYILSLLVKSREFINLIKLISLD